MNVLKWEKEWEKRKNVFIQFNIYHFKQIYTQKKRVLKMLIIRYAMAW